MFYQTSNLSRILVSILVSNLILINKWLRILNSISQLFEDSFDNGWLLLVVEIFIATLSHKHQNSFLSLLMKAIALELILESQFPESSSFLGRRWRNCKRLLITLIYTKGFYGRIVARHLAHAWRFFLIIATLTTFITLRIVQAPSFKILVVHLGLRLFLWVAVTLRL